MNVGAKILTLAGILFPVVVVAETGDTSDAARFPAWEEGYLDIHHINTGRGDAAYFIFPDGTEMLFDVGDLGASDLERYAPLKVAEPRPNTSKAPGEWVAEYIEQARPRSKPLGIDYALVSHFHSDHYGNAEDRKRLSASGDFIRTGITEVGDLIPIGTLIDRAYPGYDMPVDLSDHFGKTFDNYRAFAREKQRIGDMRVEAFHAGSKEQIHMLYEASAYPDFEVRNIKSNGKIWSGEGSASLDYLPLDKLVSERGRFNENLLSLALKVSYGPFDYFTGGDTTGLQGFGLAPWEDLETPVGEVVGRVDALVLNHHGNRDATNESFLRALSPRVIVQQSWVSDHPGGEVLHRMASKAVYPDARDIFSTNMLEETKIAIGPWLTRAYSSMEGHIVIRVSPGGERYSVYVLNDRIPGLYVRSIYGPYESRR